MKKIFYVLSVTILLFWNTGTANATLLSGDIVNLHSLNESQTNIFYWGDGTHDLYQGWSVYGYPPYMDNTTYVFGTNTNDPWTNVDWYAYHNLTDISTITDATSFNYRMGVGPAQVGDTIFFRGTNGYYGAWIIDALYIDPTQNGFKGSTLNGRWYFQDDGTGNFGSSSSVPEPATMLLLGGGLVGLAAGRRMFKRNDA